MMQQAIGPSAVQFDYVLALQDAQAWEAEYGQPVVIHIRGEGDVARDAYGSKVARPTDRVTMSQNTCNHSTSLPVQA